jgi:hypothetical protein
MSNRSNHSNPIVKKFFQNIGLYSEQNKLGILIFVISLVILLLGYLHVRGTTAEYIVQDLYANVGVDLFSIALTISIIDYLAKKRQEKELKEQLIQDL